MRRKPVYMSGYKIFLKHSFQSIFQIDLRRIKGQKARFWINLRPILPGAHILLRYKRLSKLFLLAFLFASLPGSAFAADSLEIRNQSRSEILNIFVEPVQKKDDAVFLRLDLAPGAADKIDNPSCMANLRVDTGLQLWLYKSVDLQNARQLLFCADYPGCLAVSSKNGQDVYEAYSLKNLVPGTGSKPVCELSHFRPLMPMKEVCALLDTDAILDDNGAYLTGLGFAGKLWAARLAPFKTGKISGDSLLEHMELRTPLSRDNIADVLATLYKQDYVPWQAEFPGQDIDFVDLPTLDDKARKEFLIQAIDKFLKQNKKKDFSRAINNISDEDGEASILLAPAESLESLANADNPLEDVQLFTMVLKPFSATLLLDVSAYKGGQ